MLPRCQFKDGCDGSSKFKSICSDSSKFKIKLLVLIQNYDNYYAW